MSYQEGVAARARERALVVLSFLEAWDGPDPPSLRAIHRATGFSLGSTHAYLQRLRADGLVEARVIPVTCVHCHGHGKIIETRYLLTGKQP